jgi:ABC-type sugar transport system ATPase subunit
LLVRLARRDGGAGDAAAGCAGLDRATARTAMMLELRAIVKRFGGVLALDGAELEATRGEIHGLCGENGAGKSTLLKILCGVHPFGSYGGSVRLDGEELRLRSTADARARGIAIVHQELQLVPEMTVAENLFLGREPGGLFIDGLELEAQARKLLAKFGVGEIDAAAPIRTLGIGLQQMVEIVRALADDARILILDEPTAALTAAECARLHAWLAELRARGTTCLYVSHRMEEIFALTDRVTVLRDGRTAATVETAATTPQKVVALMVGRDLSFDRLRTGDARGAARLEIDALSMGPLEDISLSLRAGEIVALAGAMGSGRTALLSTLFGCAESPLRGRVTLDGKPFALDDPRAAIAAGVAYVPEDRKGRGLCLGLTVDENLALPEIARGNALGWVDDLAEEARAAQRIRELGVRGRGDAEAATLSGGNQQKLVLGKWLAAPPKLLLLDEPTRGVDVGAREDIYALLVALAERGVAILFASSDLAEVGRLAQRIVVLRKGRIVGELPAGASQDEIVTLSTGATTLLEKSCA